MRRPSVGANDLDKLYHENTEFPTDGASAQRFEEILAQTTRTLETWLTLSDKTRGNQRKKAKLSKFDVISVLLLVQDLSRNKFRKIEKTFYSAVAKHLISDREKNRRGKSTSGTAIRDYYEAWREALLPDIGIQLDPRRLFEEQQKAAIFQRDGGSCQICKKPIEAGDDEYDHFPVRHELGGRTEIENGRLVCKACHPRGRLPVGEEDDETDAEIASALKGYEMLPAELRNIFRKPLLELMSSETLNPEERQRVWLDSLAKLVKKMEP